MLRRRVTGSVDEDECALSYAKGKMAGCPEGEIHVYDDAREKIVETIQIDGGAKYGPVQ